MGGWGEGEGFAQGNKPCCKGVWGFKMKCVKIECFLIRAPPPQKKKRKKKSVNLWKILSMLSNTQTFILHENDEEDLKKKKRMNNEASLVRSTLPLSL